jgi:pilus assembly protein CpaD
MNRSLIKFSLVALAVAGLAACASTKPPSTKLATPAPATPLDDYKPRVAEATQDLPLAVHAEGLSPNQQRALLAFSANWAESENEIEVKSPTNVGDPVAARRMADAVGAYLQQSGVPAGRIRLATYDAMGAEHPVVVVSFRRLTAVLNDCSKTWDNLTKTKNNTVSTQFGCSVSSNIALMIDNPADLQHPTQVDPADASRRQLVLTKYRNGQVTSSTTDSQASGAVTSK